MDENLLIKHLPEIVEQLRQQLEDDQKRWGDTWRHRPRKGQEDRIFAAFRNYYDRYRFADVPVPWLRILGHAVIALTREDHPEHLISGDEWAHEEVK